MSCIILHCMTGKVFVQIPRKTTQIKTNATLTFEGV